MSSKRAALVLLALLPFSVLLATADDPVKGDEPAPVLTADECARCHSNAPLAKAMRDAQGREISPHGLWESSMMANSTRDPLWRAVVSAEVAATPSRQADIEATCLRCHAPMAAEVGFTDHATGSLMHLLDCDSSLGRLARDGVSCTICHGMSPANLGSQASYSGGFELDGARRLFGPHQRPFTRPMQMHVAFTPTFGAHVTESSLCGTCHTLETEALDAEGNDLGVQLVEQAPYLEWLNSAFPDERSCQDCHMPTLDADGETIEARIARNPGGRDFPPVRARAPFGRHTLVGGNTLVLGILRDHAEALGVLASEAALDATLEATRLQLRRDTAKLSLVEFRREGRELGFDVEVENLTGHKFPTAHPTRRAWLRVLVRGADGRILFASGRADAAGRIVDGAGQPLPSERVGGPLEPHRDRITKASEVASFESKMGDFEGRPTHLLLRGASYLKDNRLLPRGWRADHPEAQRTRPVGVEGDTDFRAGSDRVHYRIQLPEALADGDLQVEVALLYQPLGARWAAELFIYETPEVARFRGYYEAADRTPEIIASARR